MKRTDYHTVPNDRESFLASVFASLYGSSHILAPIVAIFLQLATIVILIVVLFVEIFVDGWADSGSNIHLIYITFLTILATLVTTLTAGAIRNLWFRRLAFLWQKSGPSTQSRIKDLTGLGGFADQVRGWEVTLSFVVVGLITTSIVAGLTPRSVTCEFSP